MGGAFPDRVKQGLSADIRPGRVELPIEKAQFDLLAPEPSPVDFDWRFDDRSANRLAEALMGDNNRQVLCVGNPTVYGAISSAGGNAFLIDRNPLLARTLSTSTFLITDLSNPIQLGNTY